MTKVLKALMQCRLQKSWKKKCRRLSKGPRRPDDGRVPSAATTATEIAFIIICKSYNSSQPFRRQLRICRRGEGPRASHRRQSPFTNFYFIPTDDWRNWTGRFKSQPQPIFIIPHFACTNNRVQTGSARSNIKTMQS